MKIGVLLDSQPSAGGLHQYATTILFQLAQVAKDDGFEERLIVFTPDGRRPADLGTTIEVAPWPAATGSSRRQWLLESFPPGRWLATLAKHLTFRGEGLDRAPVDEQLRKALRGKGVSWLFFLRPTPTALATGLPFVMPVHDLQHRLQPHFPEVSARGEWGYREHLYRNAARRPGLLLADSETGRQHLLRFYGESGLAPDSVEVVPFLPSSSLQENGRRDGDGSHGMAKDAFFYPAQFWPHKNHLRIVEALGLLAQAGLRPRVVLSGSCSGKLRRATFRAVERKSKRLGVYAQITYLGYVADNEVAGLYRRAAALVMPTYFGPTNIPVLEAWALGCPVITSDIEGIREQAGDAAILVNPDDAGALAQAMRRILTEPGLRSDLAARGQRRLRLYTAQDCRRHLRRIVVRMDVLARSGDANGN